MGYRLAADLTLILHLAFIIFVLLGGLLCLNRARWAWLHLPAVIWGVLVEWAGWICPLTPLENYFRRIASGQGYQEGFIEHYLLPIIYPRQLTISLQLIMGLLVLSLNVIIYLWVWRKKTKRSAEVDG